MATGGLLSGSDEITDRLLSHVSLHCLIFFLRTFKIDLIWKTYGVNIPIRSITIDYKKNKMRTNIIVVTGRDLNCR